MKVIVNQQVITRPEVYKAIKPGFQNFGKNVKINKLGQLVTRSEEAKELKKAFGLENAFKDIGYQNIGEKIVIELQNTGQKAKGKGIRPVTPPGQSVSQNNGQKGKSINTLA
ncbi:MAG: hypothetical protein JYX80_08925 [Candidatus Scalindua sediminis]|nr:hypothetical protein [Candidatus Scalindua sediminis]HDY67996.1 hypothetical protein [Candidatus Scalindua sp.]